MKIRDFYDLTSEFPHLNCPLAIKQKKTKEEFEYLSLSSSMKPAKRVVYSCDNRAAEDIAASDTCLQ